MIKMDTHRKHYPVANACAVVDVQVKIGQSQEKGLMKDAIVSLANVDGRHRVASIIIYAFDL